MFLWESSLPWGRLNPILTSIFFADGLGKQPSTKNDDPIHVFLKTKSGIPRLTFKTGARQVSKYR